MDEHINDLAAAIVFDSDSQKSETGYGGILNYVCTRLTLQVIKMRFGKINYSILSHASGVLSNISSEFYRRIMAPYEDKKIIENGDVDLYEEFSK